MKLPSCSLLILHYHQQCYHSYSYWTVLKPLKHVGFRTYSSLSPNVVQLVDNIKWTSYTAPHSKTLIKIAEVVDIDPIMDYTIEKGLPEPFGIVTWDSSYNIADLLDIEYYKTSKESPLRGKTVCDVGCGTGLASLLCLSYGAKVIALDFNQFSLQLGRISYDRYLSEHDDDDDVDGDNATVDFRYYDLLSSDTLPRCDLLLISDVTYYESLALIVASRY